MNGKSVCFLSALAGLVLAARAQTAFLAATTPAEVIDRGPSWRVWRSQFTLTNPITGQTTLVTNQFTELENGLCFWSSNHWTESEDLIEPTPSGAEGTRGPIQADFSPNLNTPGALSLAIGGGVYQSHPVGLYYFDAASGQSAEIARVIDSSGVIAPPNTVIYSNCLSGLSAAMVYVYAHNGFEQNLALFQAPPPPEAYGLSSATSRLELWTLLDNWPSPQAERPLVVASQNASRADPDLVDHLFFYADCWLPIGRAFASKRALIPDPARAARVSLWNPAGGEGLHVAKTIVQIGQQSVLVESLNYLDTVRLFEGLGHAAVEKPSPAAPRLAVRGRKLPPASQAKRLRRPMEVAAGLPARPAAVLDYVILPDSGTSWTFTNGVTYYIPVEFYIQSGTFQAGSCMKYGTNAWLVMYTSSTFPSSGAPAVFTSRDDNAYGAVITNSTSVPNYEASQAIWMYYQTVSATVSDILVRWAQIGIEFDENSGITNLPSIGPATFQDCTNAIYLNVADDTLSISSNTNCNVLTAVAVDTGSYTGSATNDCGVVSVARLNDPSVDTASGDPNKNSQSECSFVVDGGSNIVAAFISTHLSDYLLGQTFNAFAFPHRETNFTGIVSPRSCAWSVSTNGGASFTEMGPLPPTPTTTHLEGDAGDTAMVRDAGNGTIYLLCNTSRDGDWTNGFRLWTSTNTGQSFTLINTNVPCNGLSRIDKPMIAVNNYSNSSTFHHLYVTGATNSGAAPFVSHSSDGGATWDTPQILEHSLEGQAADIAIRTNGSVYAFFVVSGVNSNQLQYCWLPSGQTNWIGPQVLNTHTNSANLYATANYGSGQLLWQKGGDTNDYFVSNAFPHAAVNPVSDRIYVVYADLPFAGSTNDRGDIFIQEAIPNPDDSLYPSNWSGEIKVNNDRTVTDQWNPAVAVNPAGTEVFVGYYSRQASVQNDIVEAYGAKANISNGLVGATFDTFPISQTTFKVLYPGTTNSSPPTEPWLFDNVWVQENVYFDTNADVLLTTTSNAVVESIYTYQNFCADDYTWAVSDASYFYYAWCDRSDVCTNTWSGTAYTRADPNIRLGKIKQ